MVGMIKQPKGKVLFGKKYGKHRTQVFRIFLVSIIPIKMR